MERKSSSSAFTLFELLVVISIILIVSSVIFVSGTSGDGTRLNTSVRVVSSLVQAARGQAILKNAEALLLIHNDSTDSEKFRRFWGIVYEQEDDPSTAEDEAGWVAANQGTYLPQGIYFDPDLESSNFGLNGRAVRIEIDHFPSINPQKGESFSTSSEPESNSYLFYRFYPNGTVEAVNEWMVLRAGNLTPDGELADYDPSGEQSQLKAALILRRSGGVTSVRDPADIENN